MSGFVLSRLPRGSAILAALTLVFGFTACSDSTGSESPRELAFSVQPLSLADGGRLTPPIAVAVHAGNREVVPGWTGEITLALEGGSGLALTGTTVQSALAGYAVFEDLRISGTGTELRLTARSGTLEEAVSGPFTVHSLFHAASVTAGWYHTCALTEQGEAYCWGYNSRGQLGDGTTQDRWMPTRVVTEERFESLSANRYHTCGLTLAGSVLCWGSNGYGEAGDGTFEDRSLPVAVTLPGHPIRVEAGAWHSCALNDVGEAYCWGAGGTLGTGTPDENRNTPALVAGAHTWTQIDAGYEGGCGLDVQGKAYCWGWNTYAEIGDGTQEDRAEPTLVIGGHVFDTIMVGGGSCHGQNCGFTADGTLLCWGKNYQRSLGPVPEMFWSSPTPLVNNPGFESFEPGPQMVCGITGDHRLYCLGDPASGMMGPLVGIGIQEPTPMASQLSVVDVAISTVHVCVVTTGREVWCWGDNRHGELGGSENPMGVTYPIPAWAPPGG